jgi:hypothetical protein
VWGRRKKRRGQLSRQLALGLLEDAMGRVQQPEEQDEDGPVPYPSPERGPTPPGPQDRAGLQATDVPVDNSAAPGPPAPADDPDPKIPLQRQRPARRSGESTRHRSFG